MSANDTTYQIILDSIGIKAWIMPEGYYPDVEIHCWGAGGGAGWIGAPGGGGGYAKTTVDINPGDEVTLQIGQPGLNATSATGAGGAGGLDNTYRNFRGGNGGARGNWCGQNGGPYPSGGGGGASFVAVEGSFVCVAAGGGGGGGYGHDNFKDPGKPGGINSGLTNDFRGGDASYGGGGGAGYFGGASGFTAGHTVTGGSGGTNFGNVTVAGSGTLPGGRATAYYPGDKKGEAGYPGYIVIILRKKFNAFIKNPDTSGDWVRANTAYVKTPSQSVTIAQTPDTQPTSYTTPGTYTFTVPAGVTSINAIMVGGGGGGSLPNSGCNYGRSNSGGGGGGGGGLRQSTLAVVPGDVINITVGGGGRPGNKDLSGDVCYYGTSGTNGGDSSIQSTRFGTLTATGGTGATPGWEFNGGPAYGGNQTNSQPGVRNGGYGGLPGGNDGAFGGDQGSAGQGRATNGAGGASLYSEFGKGGDGGSAGRAGIVTLSYTPAPVNVTVVTGGWKEIQQAFTKVNGLWKPLLTNEPIELYNYPVKRRAVNINIVVPTYDFVVYDNLPVRYFEGLLDVNVYIAANTTVGSTDVTTPAFLVDRFSPGDTVKISNYGNISGRGGDGGAAGSYSVTTSYSYSYNYNTGCFLAGAMINTPDGPRAIEEIQVGDIVYAFNIGDNLDYSVALEPKVITKTYVHTWEEVGHTSPLIVITHSGGELVTTTVHEILTSSRSNPTVEFPGFVNAEDLQSGDIIYAADGSELTVISTRLGEPYDLVYNLEVDDFHTYVADNVRVHNGVVPSYNPKGGYQVATTTVNSVPGRPGQFGGAGLKLDFPTVIENFGTIAGGGGGGGGGGGPTGGRGGGGAGAFPGNGGNNGTLTAGGAGLGIAGAGGARGTRGTNGTNSSSAGGLGGQPGAAVVNNQNAIFTVAGTTIGPII